MHRKYNPRRGVAYDINRGIRLVGTSDFAPPLCEVSRCDDPANIGELRGPLIDIPPDTRPYWAGTEFHGGKLPSIPSKAPNMMTADLSTSRGSWEAVSPYRRCEKRPQKCENAAIRLDSESLFEENHIGGWICNRCKSQRDVDISFRSRFRLLSKSLRCEEWGGSGVSRCVVHIDGSTSPPHVFHMRKIHLALPALPIEISKLAMRRTPCCAQRFFGQGGSVLKKYSTCFPKHL